MSKIVIYIITFIAMLMFSNSLDNKQFPVTKLFHSVATAYKELMGAASRLGKVLVQIAIGMAVVFIGSFSFERSIDILGNSSGGRIIFLMLCIYIILLISVYFVFGIPLLIFSKIECLLKTIRPSKLCYRYLITSFILFLYSYFLYFKKDAVASCGNVFMAGLLVSYILNMSMLIHISMEPVSCSMCKYGIKRRIEQKYPLKIVLAGALILIMLIVLNLFLGVVMISDLFEQAYVNVSVDGSVTYLDLFYYTVISFTTIGYGEIVPRRLESKVMAILIAYTSVMCLVIFVSSILALKDKLDG